MGRADVVALASPPCDECGKSVKRAETRWHLDEDCNWRRGRDFMVCADGHRVAYDDLWGARQGRCVVTLKPPE
jgi:hypothetical protein